MREERGKGSGVWQWGICTYICIEMETLAYVRGGDRGERLQGRGWGERLERERLGERLEGRGRGEKGWGGRGWGGWKIKKASSMETNMCIRKSSILADHGLQACT